MTSNPTVYDVFAMRDLPGGKRVAVFADAAGDLQARAAETGTPLSVFVEQASAAGLGLRVFTPTREKGESDSASIAALAHFQAQLADVVEVRTGATSTPAQLCGSEWLLQQGIVQVQQIEADLSALGLSRQQIHTAATARPNLIAEVENLAALDSFQADAEAISSVNSATDTTGLILYTRQAPAEGPQRRADVCFRAFGPLKGFLEDAASSNMLACLTGVLAARQLLPADTNLIRAAQRMPGQFALLTAQFGASHEAIWVGGKAQAATL